MYQILFLIQVWFSFNYCKEGEFLKGVPIELNHCAIKDHFFSHWLVFTPILDSFLLKLEITPEPGSIQSIDPLVKFTSGARARAHFTT